MWNWLRYQKIFEKTSEWFVVKEAELLAPTPLLKDLISILNLPDNIEREKKIIQFDLKIIDILQDNLDKIKKLNLPVSFNIYPETLVYLLNHKDWPQILDKLTYIKNELNWKFVLEIVENWKEIDFKEFEKIFKILWIEVSIDDVVSIYNCNLDNRYNNNHLLEKVKDITIKNKCVKYIKIDLLFSNYLCANYTKLSDLYKFFEKIDKTLIFEWIESEEMIKTLEKYKEPYKKIKVFYQWFYLHKPEELWKE